MKRAAVGLLAFLSIALAPTSKPATRPAKIFHPDQFLRFVDDPEHPRLETAIVTLRGDDGFTVDLVGAVHVADKSFYTDLNHRFGGYDSVLYEMVKHKGAVMTKGPVKTGSGVSAFQRFLSDSLDLTFQLDEIDYTADNFVHADMDVDAFYAAQEKRGESLMSLMFQSMLSGMSNPQAADDQPDLFQLLWAMKQPDKHRQLKLILGKSFGGVESAMAGLDGPDGSAILTDRNDACLKVLREQRAAGKKHVAIFYGAAHFADMATQLVVVDKLKPVKSEWLVAWDLTPAPTTQPAK
jgi:hypothetical protein